VHLDLRYFARRVELSGGQKAIERDLALPQRAGLEDVDGAQAVLLWHRYLRGNPSSLRRLIEYNRYDVLGMCGILDRVLDRLNAHHDLWHTSPKFSECVKDTADWLAAIPVLLMPPHVGRRSSTFEELFAETPAENATVVGIDLTSSEVRPSGWSVLQGAEAWTDMVASDDEIVARTTAAKPAVVSIDSPLSIPFGRIRVEDDDPGREQFGIMRRCERELKRRGINVYPCLLPSMQGLTRRGMRLADRFRSVGIPVIESYPGAAQDIMGIPRKGAGAEFLKQGLVDFGIRGPFAMDEVTHDELDAITSAIVGSFFLSGRFEALRGPTEDALIIPDLTANGQSGMVIGISGRICAGKTTTARLLEELGFAYTRFSLVIDDEIAARGDVLDRATRQRVGMEINRTKGQRWLCERVLSRVAGQANVVVDGLRFPEDHAFFVERFGSKFVHLHIGASQELRALRYSRSEQAGLPFELVDHQAVESKIDELGQLAGATVGNDSSVAMLREKVPNCLKALAQARDDECLSLVVVGGQFGSEGKGKVALEIVRRDPSVAAAVRVGGTNSGHTGVGVDRRTHALRQLPAAAIDRSVQVVLPPGSYIDLHILDLELKLLGLGPDSVAISPMARIITDDHKQWEQAARLGPTIGSTQSGTGAAVIAMTARGASLDYA
jgi:predicted nuclease with RNAse H fold/dephospho-CoA kinase